MTAVLLFAAAAAMGTTLRAVATADQPATTVPWRTLGVNCLGAFVLGYITTSLEHGDRWILAVAGLGSLTTFSAVVAETIALIENHRRTLAVGYVLLSLALGTAAAWAGLELGAI